MREFDRLCKEFEEMDSLSYSVILTEKSAKVIPALSVVMDDGLSGVAIFAMFVMAAIAADGRLSEDEYALCYPLLHAFFGDEIDYEKIKSVVKQFKREGKELKKVANEMVDIFGQLSEDLKDDIIIICMMICAVDGKISLKEKNWIKKLIK
jgi:uncharacterized tellurite resistance protein B-like protein